MYVRGAKNSSHFQHIIAIAYKKTTPKIRIVKLSAISRTYVHDGSSSDMQSFLHFVDDDLQMESPRTCTRPQHIECYHSITEWNGFAYIDCVWLRGMSSVSGHRRQEASKDHRPTVLAGSDWDTSVLGR